jgi:Uma2 family endonuclease
MLIFPLLLEPSPPASSFQKLRKLPDPSELIDSDDKPMDNELQYLIPTLLKLSLNAHWQDRQDWFFGVNMGIYHAGAGFQSNVPIVPDAFLSLGVKPTTHSKGRLSYIVWLEDNIVPTWVLECVSQTYGAEYGDKMKTYAKMGVLHYVIYNPHHYRRDQHDPLEVYRLVRRKYQRQKGDRVWLPELALSLGRDEGTFQKWQREWLYWYDDEDNRLPAVDEQNAQLQQQLEQEQQRAKLTQQQLAQEQQRAQRLANFLRKQGIDPDTL